jgi:hypothetical protein
MNRHIRAESWPPNNRVADAVHSAQQDERSHAGAERQ